MTTAAITTDRRSPWREELRATLLLAWPLILTNVTMVLINSTDVFLLARLGPDALAASALGTGILFAMMLVGIGIVVAGSPLMAAELGRKANSVRDIRRTFRQTLWSATVVCIPIWALLWFTGDLLSWAGQPDRLADDTGQFMRAIMWLLWPQLGVVALRSFMAALELPKWTMVAGFAAVVVNAVLNYGLIFGHFGLPRLELVGAGIGSSLTGLFQFLFLAVIAMLRPKFRRYHLFGRWWRSDWQRFATIWKLGFPIGLHMGFEAMVFAAAIFLMGYISIEAAAAHAVAIQIASMTFMVPMGLAQAATVRVGLGYGRRDAEAIRLGDSRHIGGLLPRSGVAGQRRGAAPCRFLPDHCRDLPDRRRCAGGWHWHVTRVAGYDMADAVCRLWILGRRHRLRLLARLLSRL
jgi:multidrug resistance protein, MATE family